MDKSDLIAEFSSQLELFEKYQTFIDKARTYSERFNPAVVEKVIADNTEKIRDVAAKLDPLVGDMQAVIAGLEADRAAVLDGAEAARLAVEELELRQAIGELDEESFFNETSPFNDQIGAADASVAALDAELESFRRTLARWQDARPDLADAEVPLQEEEEENVVLDHDDGEEDDVLAVADERGDAGIHAEVDLGATAADDVSPVFDTGSHATASHEALDVGGYEAPIDAGDVSQPVTRDDSAGHPVLILAEGTGDEVVYAFVNDELTIGRARDNNVQVKNDSKVSRNHCRLYRRDAAYFITDNKSANGTLVDGELITEKRLFGGEEVIIGETPFRFRIHT